MWDQLPEIQFAYSYSMDKPKSRNWIMIMEYEVSSGQD